MSAESIESTLEERGKRYGEFPRHAHISQSIKAEMRSCSGWHKLGTLHREALEMIAHQMGRILNGNPNYHNFWYDIATYALLVANQLLEDKKDD